MSHYFTPLEDLIYSFVEYIPSVGTVYSFKPIRIFEEAEDDKRIWASVCNMIQGGIRDVVLLYKAEPVTPVVIIHSMAEGFSDKQIDVWWSETKPGIRLSKRLDHDRMHLVVAGLSQQSSEALAEKVFAGKAKGVHHFHRACFIGKLKQKEYAEHGVPIALHLPDGLYDGALATFSWKWEIDAKGRRNRPDYSHGRIKIMEGTNPTQFELMTENYYKFKGTIKGKDEIAVEKTSPKSDQPLKITMYRNGRILD